MKHIRRLYVLTGIIWGTILGTLSAYIIGGGIAGIFWGLIFGDNAWPSWAWIVVYTVAALAGVLVFGACVFVGLSHSRQLTTKHPDHQKEFHRVVVLLLLACIVISGYGLLENYRDKKNSLLQQQILKDEKKRKEDALPYPKTGESDVDYYCRVIRKGSKIELFYQGHRIKIVQEILLSDQLLFAVAAPYDLVNEIAREIIIREQIIAGNKNLATEFIALPDNVICDKKMYFISSKADNLPPSLNNMKKVHGSIPSISIGFDFNIRY